jgi:hypothetical protein
MDSKGVQEILLKKPYHDDYAAVCPTTSLRPSQRVGIYGDIRGKRNVSGASSMACPLTIHGINRGAKQDKTFYQDVKDSRDFNAWKKH